MKKNNGIEFLLYSYFKIELNATKDEIIKSAIKKAYTDATNQGAYNTKIKTASEKYKSLAAKIKSEKVIESFIEKSLNENDYDGLHEKKCNELVTNYIGLSFTYGNAQKWINMTMKNLYVISLIFCEYCEFQDSNSVEFCKKILGISYKFHVPIDSYIIEKIWDTKIPLPEVRTLKNGEKGKYASDKVKGWSSWDKKTYTKCQDALKKYIKENYNNISPIEWESSAWIEIAKKRSAK